MNDLGKALIAGGVVLILCGIALISGVGRSWVGRLPGDFHYERGNVRVFFPLATSLVASAVLTLLLWLLRGRK